MFTKLQIKQFYIHFHFLIFHFKLKGYILKVSKSRKKKWNSQFFQKTNETQELLRQFFQVFRSFFGRIDNFKNCFRDLLTFTYSYFFQNQFRYIFNSIRTPFFNKASFCSFVIKSGHLSILKEEKALKNEKSFLPRQAGSQLPSSLQSSQEDIG